MKLNKIFIYLICFFLSISSVCAQEITSLYLIKNIPRDNLVNIVDNVLTQSHYKILYKDDFYILPPNAQDNSRNFYEVIITQNDNNCYLYYSAEDNVLETILLKEIKKGHYKIQKMPSVNIDKTISQRAADLRQNVEDRSNSVQNYDFSNKAQEEFDKENHIPDTPQTVQFSHPQYSVESVKSSYNYKKAIFKKPQNISNVNENIMSHGSTPLLHGAVVTIAKGTVLNATLQSSISSASLAQSDRITAVLDDDFRYNGYLIFPAQTVLYGNAIQSKSAGYAYSNGSLDISFNQVLLPNGNRINISTQKISYIKNSERAVNITKNVVAGAGLGILTGLLSAAYTGDYAQAALVGASIGAAGGGVYAAAQKGQDTEISEGTKLNLTISQPINISPYKD